MAILIPSENIYQPKNNKILDNRIMSIELNENSHFYQYEEVDTISLNIYTTKETQTEYDNVFRTEYINEINNNALQPKFFATNTYSVGVKKIKRTYAYYSQTVKIEKPYEPNKIKLELNSDNIIYLNNGSTIDLTKYSQKSLVNIDEDKAFDNITHADLGGYIDYLNFYDNEQQFLDKYIVKENEEYLVKKTFEYNGTIYDTAPYMVMCGATIKNTELTYYLLILQDIYGGSDYKSINHLVSNYTISFLLNLLNTESSIYSKSQDNEGINVKLQNTELTQIENQINGENFNDYFVSNILSKYKNGKETVTLTCPIDDYYEYDSKKQNFKGAKVISPNAENSPKMAFENGDIVVPMVLDLSGKNTPISTYEDNTAKEFVVLRNKFIYNGMLFQELQCQEFVK